MKKNPLLKLFVTLIMFCAACKNMDNRISVASVERDIQKSLSIGCSKAQVFAFLDARKITHSRLEKGVLDEDGKLRFPVSHEESGIIRDVRRDGGIFKILVSIQVDFKFDVSDSELVSYSVHEVYTGP